jgi:hypothetical protein
MIPFYLMCEPRGESDDAFYNIKKYRAARALPNADTFSSTKATSGGLLAQECQRKELGALRTLAPIPFYAA